MINLLLFGVYVILVLLLIYLMYYVITMDKPVMKKVIVDDSRYHEEMRIKMQVQNVNRKLQGMLDEKEREVKRLILKNERLESEIEKFKEAYENAFQKQNNYSKHINSTFY